MTQRERGRTVDGYPTRDRTCHHSAPVATGRSGDHVLTAPEEADPEVPRAIKAIKLQHDLSVLFDQDGHDHLLAHFDAQPNSEADFMRLKDLRDDNASSKWLWTVDPRFRLTLDSQNFHCCYAGAIES